MGMVVLLIIAAAAVFTVAKGTLGAWFAKPGDPAQRVVIVSPAGPTLWQRTAGFIVGALFVAVPAVLLLKQTGQHHEPVTNYFAPTVTSTTLPNTAGGNR
ncbi:hypothetical protein GCM10009839_40050 [Catenulispora yoronensis]|uniref:RDD domain-containing protein n=1 Tax=Catenulispora yoronensis TaxID=450799 RepID=A0ABP5FWI9_9ACTN